MPFLLGEYLRLGPIFRLRAALSDPASLTVEKPEAARALNGTVQETLRLFPIAPRLYRHVGQAFDFGGYHLASDVFRK
jgi:cytochrome P450